MARRPWTAEEVRWLRRHLGRDGWTYAAAAKYLGRSVNGIKLALYKRGVRKPLTAHAQGTLAIRDLCEVMGLCGAHSVAREWIQRKLLKARKASMDGSARTHRWVIYSADLIEFLRRHPEHYEAWRIPRTWRGKPNPYRQYAKKALRRYLTTKQYGQRAGLTASTIRTQARRGQIAAEKVGREWRIAA